MEPVRLGASEFAAAIGHCPYTSRPKLWRRKMGLEIRQDLAILEWGKQFEHKMVETTQKRTGMVFFNTGEDQKKIRSGRLTVIPDGICEDVSLEGKVRAIKNEPHKEVPAHYMCQVQGACAVGGFTSVIFSSWTHREVRIWRVPRSEEFIGVMMPAVHSMFWWLDLEVSPPRFKKGEKVKLPPVLTELIYEGRS